MRNFGNSPRTLSFAIATGFYSGLARKAPGTIGSIVAIPFWVLIWYFGLWSTLALRIVVIVAVIAVGTWASLAVMRLENDDSDPQHIVVDEWAGMLIAFLPVTQLTALSILLVLLWFRLFDILKPGPVGWAERIPGAYGVMADDCVAGAMAALMVFLSQMGLGNI